MKNMRKILILVLAAAAVTLVAGCSLFQVPSNNVKFYVGDELIYEADVRTAEFIGISKVNETVVTPEGYIFDGFYDESGVKFTKQYSLTGDAIFNASFSPLIYTITYDLEDGISTDNPSTYTVETETFTLSAPYGQAETYVFVGWTTPENGAPKKTVTINKGSVGNLHFKANFEDTDKYYLYFETNGGSEVNRIENKTGNFDISAITSEKTGYNFVNWYSDSNLLLPVISGTYHALTKSATVYAKWEIITYTITFTNCDLETVNYTVETDDFTLDEPELTGYTFTGYTYDGLVTPRKPFTVVKGTHRDYALTANFSVNTYTVTYDTLGGSEIAPSSYEYGATMTAPADPEKEGCSFLGWCSDELCELDFVFGTMPAGDITLYANWYSDDNYTIQYSINGTIGADITASRVSGSKVHAGETVVLSAPAYAYGGIFKYWSRKTATKTEFYSYDNFLEFEMPYRSLNLIAEYEAASSYAYLKGTYTDLTISNRTLSRVLGNGITTDDYAGTAINYEYLESLADGDYLFSTLTRYGAAESKIIRVTGGSDHLTTIKLDYDVKYPSVTLLFDAYGDYEYEYSLNSSSYAPCTSGMILNSFNKQRVGGNRITVRRVDDTSDSLTLNKSAYNSVNATYYTSTFTLNGLTYDFVIEDYDELQAVMGYFSYVYAPDSNNREYASGYAGGRATLRYYIEQNFRDEFIANEDEYVKYVVSGSLPYYPAYDFDYASSGVETVRYYFMTDQLNTERTSQVTSLPSDGQKLLSATALRTPTYDDFEINSFAKTQQIRTLYELESLAYGVKPVFTTTTGQAYAVYEAAKQVLRNYVSDDMTPFQKITAIYDYLALNVTYDYVAAYADRPEGGSGHYSCFTSYGALVEHVAVCDGIASAYKILCQIEGIECEEYVGYAVSGGSAGGHAWNKVKIGGVWYGVDATWCTTVVSSVGYVYHQNYLNDEVELYSSGHRERATTDEYGYSVVESPIYDAACGTIDYFDIEVYGSGGLTRNITIRNDLTKLIAYYKTLGATCVEIKNSSIHDISSLIMGTGASGSALINASEGVYFVFFN